MDCTVESPEVFGKLFFFFKKQFSSFKFVFRFIYYFDSTWWPCLHIAVFSGVKWRAVDKIKLSFNVFFWSFWFLRLTIGNHIVDRIGRMIHHFLKIENFQCRFMKTWQTNGYERVRARIWIAWIGWRTCLNAKS
jgi:hypothetical protein